MKSILSSLILVIALPAMAATHTAAFSYTASADSTTQVPGTVTSYYAQGACGTTGQTFSVLQTGGPASATTASPWANNLPSAGTYCFYLEAVIGGASSSPSTPSVGGTAAPFPPTAVTVVVQ